METKAEMATWNGLPVELRGLILEHLALSAVAERRSKNWKAKGSRHDMGSYAVVCRQWQGFVEKVNFSSLEINSVKDLSRFDELLQDPRRRSLLRRLALRIELPRYALMLAKIPETDSEQNANEISFTQGIWNLFDILSKWAPSQCNVGGIQLELSAFSPSDKIKFFGEAGLDLEGNSRFFDHDLDFSFITAGCEQVGRHGLPEVSVVTSCQVLRRNHRNFSSRSLLTLFSSLPQLREVRYEPWHQVDMEAQLEVDSDHARTLPFWPSYIKRISIFEHFDAFNDGAGSEWEDADSLEDDEEAEAADADNNGGGANDPTADVPRTACPSLGQNLGWLSLQAEEMAVSNVADAFDFFGAILARKAAGAGAPVWKNLRRLTLTSHSMISGVDPENINTVLHQTGSAAKHMPTLKMLELYKVDQFGAAVFRYSVDTMSTTASWESTWEFRAEPRVKSLWADVARKNTGRELSFLPEKLLGEYRGPFIFIDENLKSKDLVLHQTSLEDMLSKKMDKCKACNGFCAHPKTGEKGEGEGEWQSWVTYGETSGAEA